MGTIKELSTLLTNQIAAAYGLKLEDGEAGMSLLEWFQSRGGSAQPVEGDRIDERDRVRLPLNPRTPRPVTHAPAKPKPA